MSDDKSNVGCKSGKFERGGFYKRRGRPGHKYRPVVNTQNTSPKGENVEEVRCSEADVGITEYIGTHKGFTGVIKQRYSDFHVNEIDLKSKVVELTSLACDMFDPAPPEKRASLKDFSDVLSEEVKAKLMLLHGANFPSVEIDVTEMSKDERRKIHEAVKSVYGNNLVSNTVDREGKKIMIIGKPKGKQRVDDWPHRTGDYVYFVMYKENMDTMEAANIIAHKLRMPVGKITYAGTKDRRAKTCQLACVPRIHPKKLADINILNRSPIVGNFSIHPTPLRLGDLKGNKFTIVLRNVTAPDDEIQEAISSLKEKGFINYYGLQRFGSTSVPTHHVGKALLLGNWKSAVELILKPKAHDNPYSKHSKQGPCFEESLGNARKIWWETRDPSAALEALGNKPRGIEGHLLMGLKRHKPNDLVNALEQIPLNTRLIYLHAYQSYIWNNIASRRLKEFGCVPIEGDLVLVEDATEDSSDLRDETIVDDEALEVESVQSEVKQDEESNTSQKDAAKGKRKASQPPKVKVLTKSDLGSVSITDIVLPLPGYDVTYPSNAVKAWYEEILALDGLSSATMKQNVKKYSLRGTYRKVTCKLKDFAWKQVKYQDPTVDLVQSALQKLKEEQIPNPIEDGKYRAVILEFCLPPSAYATMALRELLKCDTSTHHQMTLNDYFGGIIGAKREGDQNDEKEVTAAKMPKLESENAVRLENEKILENKEVIAAEMPELEKENKIEIEKEKFSGDESSASVETEKKTDEPEEGSTVDSSKEAKDDVEMEEATNETGDN